MKENSLISSMTTVLSIATCTASRLQESNTASFLDGDKGVDGLIPIQQSIIIYLKMT